MWVGHIQSIEGHKNNNNNKKWGGKTKNQKQKFPREEGIPFEEGNIETLPEFVAFPPAHIQILESRLPLNSCLSFQPAGMPGRFQTYWPSQSSEPTKQPLSLQLGRCIVIHPIGSVSSEIPALHGKVTSLLMISACGTWNCLWLLPLLATPSDALQVLLGQGPVAAIHSG